MCDWLELSTQSWFRISWALALRGDGAAATSASARQNLMMRMSNFPLTRASIAHRCRDEFSLRSAHRQPLTGSRSLAAALGPPHHRDLQGPTERMMDAQGESRRFDVGRGLLAQPLVVPLVAAYALLALPHLVGEAFDRRKQWRECRGDLRERMTVHRDRSERNRLVEPQRVLRADGRPGHRRVRGRRGGRSGGLRGRDRRGRRGRRGGGGALLLQIVERRPAVDQRALVAGPHLVGNVSPIGAVDVLRLRDADDVAVEQRVLVDVAAGLLADVQQARVHLVRIAVGALRRRRRGGAYERQAQSCKPAHRCHWFPLHSQPVSLTSNKLAAKTGVSSALPTRVRHLKQSKGASWSLMDLTFIISI